MRGAFVGTLSWASAGTTGHGSLFYLDLEEVFAVTADHVFAGYLNAKRENPGLEWSMDGLVASPEERLIDRDAELDLATFRVSRAELTASGKRAYACPAARWPPPPPEPGQVGLLAGFLANNSGGDGSARPRARRVRARIDDVNDRHVACALGAADDPPRLRGASGAPLWVRTDGHPWRPAGIVKKCLERHGILVAIRLDAIRPDGTLVRWT